MSLPTNRPWRIYIAGRLSADSEEGLEENIQAADAAAKAVFLKGHYPYCPHTQAHTWHSEEDPAFSSYDQIVGALDIRGWLVVCDVVVFLDGWEKSKGSVMEYGAAHALSKPIFFSVDDIPDISEVLEGDSYALYQTGRATPI